jgi:hypothetical protein
MGRSDDSEDDENRKKPQKSRKRRDENSCSSEDEDRTRRKRKKHSKTRKHKDEKKHRRKSYSSDSSDSESYNDNNDTTTVTKVVVNDRLLQKLAARGETIEERRARRAAKRAAHISQTFGYTPEDNPFNDPNLHESFTWNKKKSSAGATAAKTTNNALDEVLKVRQRRHDRQVQVEELERIRAEESRMKELENYDDWAKKEQDFHLQQQRQRSAIRLVEGRERPVDVLAKNMLLFGLSQQEKNNRAAVKYKEKYNAMDDLENLEAELDEPYAMLRQLKLNELEELLVDINAFRALEREASDDTSNNPVLRYWDGLYVVARDEIEMLKTGGANGSHATMAHDIQAIFAGQSLSDLLKMQTQVQRKLREHAAGGDGADADFDRDYWKSVEGQLSVYLAQVEISQLHSKMLVRQLERLEKKKEELANKKEGDDGPAKADDIAAAASRIPDNVDAGFGDLEEEVEEEIDLVEKKYSWQDKYRPRKPRYFNRVKTGYDWNKYNQTHYDKDNPPPKTVQGYKFNIFYPDLIDPTKTPQFFLEPADSNEFCILRFHAGPPYQDVAFKILNREWNRSRKRGYKCSFERGVLSLYFNFATHWYRR